MPFNNLDARSQMINEHVDWPSISKQPKSLCKLFRVMESLRCLCLQMLSPWSCSIKNKIQMKLLNLVNVDKHLLFVVSVCMFCWDNLNSKFFQITIKLWNGKYKKQETDIYREGKTYIWKRTREAMCLGSKENNKMGKSLSNGSQVKPYFFMVS